MGFRTKAGELKHKAGQLLQRADQLDQRVKDALDNLLDGSVSLEPIDIRKDVLRQIGGKLVTIRPGKRSFPFKFLTIEFFVPDEERQAIFETAFVEAQALQTDIQIFLQRELGEKPAALRIAVNVQVAPPPADVTGVFRLVYRRTAMPDGEAHTQPNAQLVILKGQTTRERYVLDKERTYIGRLPQVTDKAGRIVRRNDIVFADNSDEANQTVSRVHAHIHYDAASGEYRLCDDLSAYGTRVVRDGQPHEAPQRRGVKLKAGDEVFFGEACARFEVE
jgi:hypothetical protein